MWYVDGFKWNESYSPQLDAAINGQWTEEWASDDRKAFYCRVHGNPLFDTVSLCWLNSVENRRGELDPKYFNEGGLFTALWEAVPGESTRAEGLHIFDSDDPEFVAMDEERLHERLTSHVAELSKQPESERPEGLAFSICKKYVDAMVLNNLDRGHASSGIHMEIFNQVLGLPYTWWGAQPDDADD